MRTMRDIFFRTVFILSYVCRLWTHCYVRRTMVHLHLQGNKKCCVDGPGEETGQLLKTNGTIAKRVGEGDSEHQLQEFLAQHFEHLQVVEVHRKRGLLVDLEA